MAGCPVAFGPGKRGMIYGTHIPGYPLGQFIEWLWFYEGFVPDHDKERVLPDPPHQTKL